MNALVKPKRGGRRRRADGEFAQNWLAALVDSSHAAIISQTLKGIVQSWNPAAEKLFGYTAEEIIGKPLTRFFPEDRRHEETQNLARLSRGERVEHFETVRIAKDGTRLDVSVTVSPIRDATGKVIGASKIVRDIRERKAREAEREKLIGELQAALEENRTLRGLLPVCSWCGKVRNDKGYWEQVDEFLARVQGVEVTHGICPDCMESVSNETSLAK